MEYSNKFFSKENIITGIASLIIATTLMIISNNYKVVIVTTFVLGVIKSIIDEGLRGRKNMVPITWMWACIPAILVMGLTDFIINW